MLWGKGDTSKLTEDEQVTLRQLRRMVETGHIHDLDNEKTQALLRALDWYTDWEGTFRVFRHIRNVGVLIGGFITVAWAAGGEPIKAIMGLFK